MSMDYYTFVQRMATKMDVLLADYEFTTNVPAAIDYAEQRIYRELDLLATRFTSISASFITDVRTLTLPSSQVTFLVVEEMSAIYPSTATSTSGTRYPMRYTSKQFIDAVYPNATTASSIPKFFAMLDNTSVLVGPPPDAAYAVEIIGTYRPTALSSANTTTYLSENLPDLFLAATMVYVTNQARQSPGREKSGEDSAFWESEYQRLFASANAEELRKGYASQGWTNAQPNTIATPPRV